MEELFTKFPKMVWNACFLKSEAMVLPKKHLRVANWENSVMILFKKITKDFIEWLAVIAGNSWRGSQRSPLSPDWAIKATFKDLSKNSLRLQPTIL